LVDAVRVQASEDGLHGDQCDAFHLGQQMLVEILAGVVNG